MLKGSSFKWASVQSCSVHHLRHGVVQEAASSPEAAAETWRPKGSNVGA